MTAKVIYGWDLSSPELIDIIEEHAEYDTYYEDMETHAGIIKRECWNALHLSDCPAFRLFTTKTGLLLGLELSQVSATKEVDCLEFRINFEVESSYAQILLEPSKKLPIWLKEAMIPLRIRLKYYLIWCNDT